MKAWDDETLITRTAQAVARCRWRSQHGQPAKVSYLAKLKEEIVRRPALSYLPPLDYGASGRFMREDVWNRIDVEAKRINLVADERKAEGSP